MKIILLIIVLVLCGCSRKEEIVFRPEPSPEVLRITSDGKLLIFNQALRDAVEKEKHAAYSQGANDAVDTLALYDLERRTRAYSMVEEAAKKKDTLPPREGLTVVEESLRLQRNLSWGEYHEVMRQRLKIEAAKKTDASSFECRWRKVPSPRQLPQ